VYQGKLPLVAMHMRGEGEKEDGTDEKNSMASYPAISENLTRLLLSPISSSAATRF
jgi:hypothetical protein